MTHKQKLRNSKRLKQDLKRIGACMDCVPFRFPGAIADGAVKSVHSCPSCGAELTFDVSSDTPEAHAHLRHLAAIHAKANNIPATIFTIMLNDKVLVEDADCDCEGECDHARMTLTIRMEGVSNG